MDLFELLIFALIAGSGLIGEMLKKKRRREAREQAERAKAAKKASEEALGPVPVDGGSLRRAGTLEDRPTADPYGRRRREQEERAGESWDPFGEGDVSPEEDVFDEDVFSPKDNVFDLETILQDTLFGGSGKRPDRRAEPPPVDAAPAVETRASQESVRRMGRIEVRASRENVRQDMMGRSTDAKRSGTRDLRGGRAEASMEGVPGDGSDLSPTLAGSRRSRFIGMLKDPSGFRDAIVLSEILRRPSMGRPTLGRPIPGRPTSRRR